MFESTAEKTEKKVNVKDMTVIALVTAVICIIAPFSIPIAISPIPITLALFALFLAGIILGKWKGVVCTVIYLLLGMVGLPVFNGFSGGVQKLVGPTGGYLIGYLFLVFFTGLFVEKFPNKIPMYFVGGIIGIIVCYAFGTVWFGVKSAEMVNSYHIIERGHLTKAHRPPAVTVLPHHIPAKQRISPQLSIC